MKTLQIFAIGVAFFLFGFNISGSAQSVNDVEIKFLKGNDSIQVNEMCFNVLKIKNTTTKKIAGNLSFSGPQNWKIISFPEEHTILNPGDSVLVPIRISPATNALGGIAYIINASFRTPQHQINASTYLSLPSTVKWDLFVNKSNPYFTANQPNTTFQIRLSNKGNTNESVKIRLEAGKLLAFINNTPNDNFEFINLRAYSDTTITQTITTDKNVTFAERLRYENNWRESAVKITASTDMSEKTDALQLYKLNSIYHNQRSQYSSPLNLDYQLYNLMSSQSARNNFKVFGSLLFPNNRDIQYTIGAQNLNATDPLNQFDWNRQLIYDFYYKDNRNNIQLGYNVSGGQMHSVNGRGITGVLRLNRNNNLYYAITQNPFSNILGQFVGYNTNLKSLTLTTELTHESKTDGSYSASSGLFGVNFSLFKYNSFTFQILGSKSDYKKTLLKDTSLLGFSYRVNYSINYKKFSLRFNSTNSEHNYIQNSGLQQATLDASYRMSTNWSFILYGTHQKYAITRYPENFYNPINYNSFDYFRLVSSITDGKLTYQIGPNYNGSIRQFYNGVSGYKSEYVTYVPGVWGALTIKLPGYRSLTPNLTINNIRFYYNTNDPSVKNYSFDKNISYSAGLSYFDNVWRVNAYYTSESASDYYRSALVDSKPSVSRSLQLRPSYENFFFNQTVKLGASLNYGYYMPSGRENVSVNLRYDQFFKKGWSLSVNGFVFTNTRVDDEQGRITTRDLNMTIAITKSFNFQQPRLQYYDCKVVLFNDLDGNKVKSNTEPPVTDVLVQVEKDQSAGVQSNIPVIKLITDENGSVFIENLPKDYYKINFTSLSNLQNLYFLGGLEQTYFNDKTRTLYIPLAESYKIKGKIILVRDPNSTEGKIDLGSVRVTATGVKGETYSVLTDNFGEFVISVPNADKYNVHINNVFGEQFNIDANEVQVQFTQNKIINIDFTFIENKREIQFGNGGELFNFSSFGSSADTLSENVTQETPSQTLAEPTETVSTTNDKAVSGIVAQPVAEVNPKTYSIQLSTIKTFVDPRYFKKRYKLKGEVYYTENNGVYRYYTGNYSNSKAATNAIIKLGLKTIAIPMAVDRALLLSGVPKGATIISGDSGTVSNINASPVVAQSAGVTAGSAVKNTKQLPATVLKGKKQYNNVSRKSPENAVKDSITSFTSEGERQSTNVRPVTTDVQSDTLNDKQAHKTYLYTIKLDASRVFRDPEYYKLKYSLPFDVNCVDKGDELVYYAGKYETIDAAKADIARYGISGYIVSIEEQDLKK